MVGQQHFATASLYVGDLLPEVNEATLYDIFSSIGPVSSVRVCRENGTRRSLGYAYVNYHTIGHAERCLETLNYTSVKGVPMRIMWSHRDPALRRSGNGNIFIKNLDKVIDTKALHDTFSLFGNILSCKVVTDEYGKSRGYGFIHYDSEEAAQLAIERLDGMTIGSKKVYVGPFKKNADRPSTRAHVFTNLYVKHFPEEWSQETLQNVFSQYGEIKSMVMTSDHKGRKFALVNFTSPSSAQSAVEELHGRKTCAVGVLPWNNQQDTTTKTKTKTKTKTTDTEATATEATATEATATEAAPPAATAPSSAASTEETVKREDSEMVVTTEEQEDATAATTTVKESSEAKEGGEEGGEEEGEEEGESEGSKWKSAGGVAGVGAGVGENVPEECLYVQRAMTKTERVAMLKETFNTSKEGGGNKNNNAGAVDGDNTTGGVSSSVVPNSVNLYVKNLSDRVTDEILREAFAPYGTITSAKIMKDERGVSKGFGFVCFAFPEEATKAVTAMHLKLFYGKPLYVGLAEKRTHRAARLQQRYRVAARQQPQQQQQPQSSPMLMMGQPTNLMQFSPVHPQQAPYFAERPIPTATATQTYNVNANSFRRPPPGYPYSFGAPSDQRHMRRTSAAAANNQNFKFTAQARNRQEFMQQQHPPPPAAFADEQPNPQKQMLGERLFPLVHKIQPELAAKITGMMLEMDNSEVVALLESEALLCAKVEEALGVLMRHQQTAMAPGPALLLPQQ